MRRNGFTLIEVLVTLVLVAFLATMVVPYMLSGVINTADPLLRMPSSLSVQGIMSNIVQGYNANPLFQNDLALMNASIVTGSYGLTANHTITKDPAFKFDPSDVSASLKVTIKDNASSQSVTYIFTREM